MRSARRRLLLLCFALLALCIAVIPSQHATNAAVSEVNSVLDQVLTDLLNNPALESWREWYGTPGDNRLVLVRDSPVPWPVNRRPAIKACIVEFQAEATPVMDFIYWNVPGGLEIYSYVKHHQPRRLAVRLDKFNLDPERAFDDQIGLCLFNIGGDAGEDGMRFGGCSVYYTVSRQDGKLIAEYEGSFRP